MERAGVKQEEAVGRRDSDEVGEGRASRKEQDSGGDDRTGKTAFLVVEAGGDKEPDLPDPDRKGKEDP